MVRLSDSDFDLAISPLPALPVDSFYPLPSSPQLDSDLHQQLAALMTETRPPQSAESKHNGHPNRNFSSDQIKLSPPLSLESSPSPVQPEPPESPEPDNTGLMAVLRNPEFLKLWAGQVFSQLADKIYLVLMIALITTRFQTADQSVSGWVSAIMVAFTIPAMLFGSVAGVYVDRWSKKQVLVLTNLVRGGLVLVLPLLLWLFQGWGSLAEIPLGFWGLLAVTFCVSTLTQFFAPAEQAVMPLVVERSQLLSANSLYTITMMAAVIVGFAAGEPLLALADSLTQWLGVSFTWGKELLVGGCYAIAGVLLIFLRPRENLENLNPEPPHIWQDIRDGLRYLKQQKQVRSALIQLVILFSVFAALAVLVVRLAELIPELKASQFGFLLAAAGVGMAIGALLLGRLSQRFNHHQLSLFGSLGMSGVLSTLSLFSLRLLPVLFLLLLLGSCASLVGIPMQTTIQEQTPEEIRGKVFGLQNNAVNIALSLPLALAGVAETFLGLQSVLLGLGGLVLVGGLLTWGLSRQANPEQPASDS